MSFLNPLLLVAGLGITLPIIAHLINRYRVRHTPWAAMQFLNRSVRVRSRQVQLRDLLLLLLRCLAVLLLAMAFARPFTSNPNGSWLPGERRAGVIVALDASFSMQHRDGEVTRFERALELIEPISQRIQPGDPVTLMLLGDEHRVVARNQAFDRQRFVELLQQQRPTDEACDLDSVTKRLRELAADMEAVTTEIYLVTDFQSQQWKGRGEQIVRELENLGDNTNVLVLPVQGQADNLAVTELQLLSGVLRKGELARYQATVRNFGPSPVANVEVECRSDGVQIDSKRIPLIDANKAETISFFVPFYNAGATRITAQIRDDSLSPDDVRRVVAVVRDRVSVLCVDGTSGETGRLIASALLARAKETDDENFVVRSVPWLSFAEQDLGDVDIVVMANVPQITAEQTNTLVRYVRQGNGLVWFAGDQVKIAEWNAPTADTLGTEPVALEGSLLPAKLGEVVDTTDTSGAGKPLEPGMPDHILCRPLRSLPEDLLSETRFLKRLEVKPSATSFAVLKLAGTQSPILLEQPLGRGNIVMFTTSAEATWNNMALTPVFPMLMQQIVTYLAGREFEVPRAVGDSLSLSYTEQPDANDAEFDTPSGQTIAVPVREFRDQYVAMLDRADQAGFYTARVSVQSPGLPIAVNVDTQESNVGCLSPTELKQLVGDSSISIATTEAELLSAIEAQRTASSSWRLFMLAGLALLVFESLFADRILRKQTISREIPSTTGGLSYA